LQAHVDAFDHIYNTERPHQGLPGRITPQTAWEATEKAEAPRPEPDPPYFVQAATRRLRPPPAPEELPAGTRVKKLTSSGTFMLAGVRYKVHGRYGFHQVLVITDGDNITVADLEGEILIKHTRPAPGVLYVGNGKPRGPQPNSAPTSPMS
jgi:hypothetical protein